jgi:CrcB protein
VSVGAWIALALLGGLGAVARDVLERGIGHWHGLFVVNLSGSFALGFLVGAGVNGDARWLVATGFLGAFTTFSAWALEPRRRGPAMLALGLLAVWLGRLLG